MVILLENDHLMEPQFLRKSFPMIMRGLLGVTVLISRKLPCTFNCCVEKFSSCIIEDIV